MDFLRLERGMKTSIVAAVALALLFIVCSEAAPSSAVKTRSTKDDFILLTRIIEPLRQLARDAQELEALVERVSAKLGLKLPADSVDKRQTWELDYGWGGGRFGKRTNNKAQASGKKRYDMYGFGGGRFGRDVDHVDIDNHDRQ